MDERKEDTASRTMRVSERNHRRLLELAGGIERPTADRMLGQALDIAEGRRSQEATRRSRAHRAFASARNSGRTVMRLMMHPKALEQFQETLRKTGMARTTGFDPAPSPPGLVPAYAARYRGVPLATARELEGRMLAEYTDGSVEYMETGTAETGTGETGEHPE